MSGPFPVVGNADYCPHCAVSLCGNPIPDNLKQHYSGDGFYKREIGMEVRGAYDGVLYWFCPDCGMPWHRWPVDSRLHRVAVPHMEKHADEVTALSKRGRARLAELTAETAQLEQPPHGA